MKKNSAFALLEVLLTVILIGIVTVGSYALVKSMSSDAAMQKFTRYATSIAENYEPFLDSSVTSTIFLDRENGGLMSRDFLESIHISEKNIIPSNCEYCNVSFDLPGKNTSPNYMYFDVVTDDSTKARFLVMEVYDIVPASQKNQMIQSLGSVFSLYCPVSACQLGESASYVRLVYPKAGSTIPR